MENHSTASNPDEGIIARCNSGALLDDIRRLDIDESVPSSLFERCIYLHNAGNLDLLALIGHPKFAALSGSAFFDCQIFFSKAIPRLRASGREMMRAVEILVKKGGVDLAANVPFEAFRNWCAADLSRAEQIVTWARSGDAEAMSFLTFALTALQDLSLARSIALDYTDERRLSGLVALGRIQAPDASEAEASLKTLLPFVAASNDEIVRCNALVPTFQVCELFPSLASVYLPAVIESAIETPSQDLLFNLARGLWSHLKIFDRALMEQVLTALRLIDPTLERLLQEVDMALRAVALGSNGDLAIDYLSEVLSFGTGFQLDNFKSTKHELATGSQERLFRILVRWLMSDNAGLERVASELLRTGEDPQPFDTSTAGLGLTGPDCIFLSRKALGWLFFHQSVAASLLVACLRDCDQATAAEIGKLLFDPLLLNYGGKARDYLATIRRGDRAYRHVRKAIASADSYLADLELEPQLKEFRPSDYQRNIERQHTHDFMRDVQKQAEKQSILFNLVHRSVLLYGRRSITYLHEHGKKARPVRMDLNSFSHSYEIPRLQIIDPVGLSLRIFALRSTKRK